MKKMGRSWEVAKAFEHSAPVSALVPASKIGHPQEGAIWLDVNGTRRQTGNLNQMIWKLPEIIAELSKLFVLAPGDVIMTGTPAGVGPIVRGDEITCAAEGVASSPSRSSERYRQEKSMPLYALGDHQPNAR